ncbi:MAG: antibiotic biosynthesis monooxygenase [Desulfobacterales bacterium]|nr:MAG: antibiotic biosynthesis monooxygenase [Desulfobacterales bacterium]
MAVKVLIKRKIKDGKLNDASKLLIKARYNAMGQQGYISSETLSGCDDSNHVLVISMWQRKEDWDQWEKDDLRKENEAAFEPLLDEPTEYEIYQLGLQL